MADTFYANPRVPGKSQRNGFYGKFGQSTENLDQYHMYRVRVAWQEEGGPGANPGDSNLPNEHKTADVYVLARCPSAAAGQATCILRLDSYMTHRRLEAGRKEPVDGTVTAVAEEVPFGIEGWSDQQF
jgi:hypothetical protein